MEIKDLLKDNEILGVVSNYKSSFKIRGLVKNLDIKNISKALKIVGLDDTYLEKDISSLTDSELWKVELATKLNNNTIIIGNLYTSLLYKDLEYIKKLLLKLHKNYHKKIVIIDNNINSFINIVDKIIVIKNKKIIYETKDFFDKELYKYINKPKIVDFIKYTDSLNIKLDKTLDIYELIKDIYRKVS